MKIYGSHDDRTIQQLRRCINAEPNAIGVLCADGHVGYSMPIGGVVAYHNYVSPSGVGYDIACGNMAVMTPMKMSDITHATREVLANEIQTRVSFGIGRKNNEPVDSPVFDRIAHSPISHQRSLIQMAQQQLGTVGSGNHYVDVLEDELGLVWVAVHFGSRGFGHKTATGFMNIAQGRAFDEGKGEGEMDASPLLLNINTPSGQDYIEAMTIAGEYAYAGREAVVQKVLDILGTKAVWSVHNHHNFAWHEKHNDEAVWVVRKGATPAFPGQMGFVGGSMGDISVILQGVESEESKDALYSTVHGAGRVMSRTQAAGKQKWHKAWCCGQRDCDGSLLVHGTPMGQDGSNPKCPKCGGKTHKRTWMERVKNGLVDFDVERAKLDVQGVVLRGAGADEAPPVYRPLQSVLDAHTNTIQIIHTLSPKIVVMAGDGEHDPYKD